MDIYFLEASRYALFGYSIDEINKHIDKSKWAHKKYQTNKSVYCSSFCFF